MSTFPRVAVAGVGVTRQARRLEGVTTLQACLEAARLALDDAGMTFADVDGIAGRWPGPGGTVFHPGSLDWGSMLGVPLRWISDTYPQGIPAASGPHGRSLPARHGGEKPASVSACWPSSEVTRSTHLRARSASPACVSVAT